MTGIKRKSVAVYCGSSLGTQTAFHHAAISLGHAIATDGRALVYGGGSKGIMGLVSGAVLECGGKVTGVVPYAMTVAGGEQEKVASDASLRVQLNEVGRERIETVVVDSMHERKVEMAKRADGFVGLPGGFGTFEEILEVTTWTQLGIHNKPVVLANILGFWDPLRQLIRNGLEQGYIQPDSVHLIVFVDGPPDFTEHESFDWGRGVLEAFDSWRAVREQPMFNWSKRLGEDITDVGKLTAT
ncbi:hypothetical protein AX17_003350 [Amanita inopinata Kibby_2008]|nr:hypothetical protein AX17_003350 [Amanita inopinata Kibby_2008]